MLIPQYLDARILKESKMMDEFELSDQSALRFVFGDGLRWVVRGAKHRGDQDGSSLFIALLTRFISDAYLLIYHSNDSFEC